MLNPIPPALKYMFIGAILSLTLTAAVFNDPFPFLMSVAVMMFAGLSTIAYSIADLVGRLADWIWQEVRRD